MLLLRKILRKSLLARDLINSNLAGGQIRYPQSSAQFAEGAGITALPNALWLPQATPSVGLGTGGHVISQANNPTFVADDLLNTVVLNCADNTTQRMATATNGELEPATGDFWFVWCGRMPTVTAGTRTLIGKRTGAGDLNGWSVDTVGGSSPLQLQFRLDPGAAAVVATTLTTTDVNYIDGSVLLIAGVCDRNAGTLRLHVWKNGVVTSSVSADPSGAPDVTVATTFKIGSVWTSCIHTRTAMASLMIGTDARGFGATQLSNLAAWMRLPVT